MHNKIIKNELHKFLSNLKEEVFIELMLEYVYGQKFQY